MPARAAGRQLRLERLTELARDQDGVVSRPQLLTVGFDRRAVTRQVTARRWQTIGSRVVVLHTGALSLRQRQWVAVLHSGAGSALSGLTAAQAEGLEGFDTALLHTVVPHGSDAKCLNHPLVQVRVRQSRALLPHEVHPARRPARERLPSAVITAASQSPTAGRARLLVISAIQQRRVRPAELRQVLQRRNRVRRRALITEAIGDAEGGVQSLPEREWQGLVRRYGLPSAVRQRPVRRPTGTWFLDCDFDTYLVSVEINGAQHEALLLAESDHERRNFLGIGGRLVITFSSHAVRHDPQTCIVMTAAALLSRGWVPSQSVMSTLRRTADRAGLDLLGGCRLPAELSNGRQEA